MDAAKWSQDIGLVKPMEDMVSNSCSRPPMLERKTRPPEQLNCPRCNSTNTKFCYYNNYSLTQPRYFCKTCRRYWTEGGSLRNVPVGGGSRKNKRSSASPKVPDLNPHLSSSSSQNHIKGRDLNLGFPAVQESGHNHNLGTSQYLQVLKMENNSQSFSSSSALELLRTGMASRGLNSFIPTPSHDSATATATATLIYSTGFCVQDYKPSISFSMDGRAANIHGVEENGGRVFFPFGEMKSANEVDHQDKGGQGNHSGGYWNNNNNNGLSW